MAPRPPEEAAAVKADALPVSVPCTVGVWTSCTPMAVRQPTDPPASWGTYPHLASTEVLLDDYIPRAGEDGPDTEAVEVMDGAQERAADVNCGLDRPPLYSEVQYPVTSDGCGLRRHQGGGNVEDGNWVFSPDADEFSDEAASAINSENMGGKLLDVKPIVAHSPGTGSVHMALKRLHAVAAVEAANRYENGPGRRVAPTVHPSEVEVALGDRRRSVLARKALKKRSAYTSRFKKVVYEELLEAELVARQARLDAVIAERDALHASVDALRAATAAAEERAAAEAAAQSTTPASPAVSVALTTAEQSAMVSPVTPAEPAAEMLASTEADPPTAAATLSEPPLTWSAAGKEEPGRWTLEAGFIDDPFPIWEVTCCAAHAA